MAILSLILAIVLAIAVAIQYKNAYPPPKTAVVAFTGTMGSGKTYSAVHMLKAEYRRRRLVYAFRLVLWTLTGRRSTKPIPPTVWSSIPLTLKYKRNPKKRIVANAVTKPLLTCEEHFPENALVLLDEISVICDQYDFDDPLIIERFGRLLKFYRHWTGGKIYITEQAVSCITKPIRDKLGTVYQCEGLSRWLLVMPFVKVQIRPLAMIDAEVSTANDSVETEAPPYFFFYSVPFLLRSRKKRNYDSRCYKPIYHKGATHEPDFGGTWSPDLTTRYLLDVTSDDKRKSSYKKDRQTEKEWIYADNE